MARVIHRRTLAENRCHTGNFIEGKYKTNTESIEFQRFLRHCPLIYVDYPGEISLKQIYGTFNRAMLKKFQNMKSLAESLTDAMVEFFLITQVRRG